ncbi:hypothetical protein SEVIR_1G047901v4 [Setaria viridis]
MAVVPTVTASSTIAEILAKIDSVFASPPASPSGKAMPVAPPATPALTSNILGPAAASPPPTAAVTPPTPPRLRAIAPARLSSSLILAVTSTLAASPPTATFAASAPMQLQTVLPLAPPGTTAPTTTIATTPPSLTLVLATSASTSSESVLTILPPQVSSISQLPSLGADVVMSRVDRRARTMRHYSRRPHLHTVAQIGLRQLLRMGLRSYDTYGHRHRLHLHCRAPHQPLHRLQHILGGRIRPPSRETYLHRGLRCKCPLPCHRLQHSSLAFHVRGHINTCTGFHLSPRASACWGGNSLPAAPHPLRWFCLCLLPGSTLHHPCLRTRPGGHRVGFASPKAAATLVCWLGAGHQLPVSCGWPWLILQLTMHRPITGVDLELGIFRFV